MCGIPCSGKSTFISNNHSYFTNDFVLLSTDKFIESFALDSHLSYNDVFHDQISNAEISMYVDLYNAIDKGKNIIWDQTNITSNSRIRKLNKIPYSYIKVAVYFENDLNDIFRRNKKRFNKSIPSHVINNMNSKWERPSIDEGFNFVLDGNRNDLGDIL